MEDKEVILKERLKNLKEENCFEMALEMMECIGSIDSELRDDLIYETMDKWLMEEKFSDNEAEEILKISIDDMHMFFGIGDVDKDSVFTRTFSVLITASVLALNSRKKFINEKLLYEVKDKVIEYMNSEKDLRGYVYGKGWAHSAAHTADALAELALCDAFNGAVLMEILRAIKEKVCVGNYVYIDEEGERMARAAVNCIRSEELHKEELSSWFQGFVNIKTSENLLIRKHIRVNIKGFLRSLYFEMLPDKDLENITSKLLKTIYDLK